MTFPNNQKRNFSIDKKDSRKTIILLDKIRTGNYNSSDVKNVSDEELELIKQLVLNLANKLIRAELASSGKTESYLENKNKCLKTINNFTSKNHKNSVIYYACQLLQFYTIQCDTNCNTAKCLNDYQASLNAKSSILGNTTNNLFVKEHEIILLYNDLINVEKSSLNKKSKLDKLYSLISKLSEIKSIIETITINIPNNTFLYYLRFSLNYASAKSVEIKFQLTKDELSDDEQVFFSTSQQTYLKLAKKDLESIAKLNKYCQEKRSSIQVNGNEYSLGQDVFRKMPASANLDILKEHLSSLIDETNTISTTTIR